MPKRASMPVYTVEEVAAHNTPDDLWIIIKGSVYDVTAYHMRHPGGSNCIRNVAGTDCTRGFRIRREHDWASGCSSAWKGKEDYKVGDLIKEKSN